MTHTVDYVGYPDRPVDENHALLVGALAGLVIRAKAEGFPYDVGIIDDDDGNHLATFAVDAPSGRYLVHVEKVPSNEGSGTP